ncbi:hypothetical protein [Halosolutus gelatinilyticus]|uniref:hypothetical protein n=1 Tax=Halosolutus gelatinilyticus TaxID=2931975 RepID=UPI001FF20218|nr:hypothetical protein [Halosolutus gelatinilyticus]
MAIDADETEADPSDPSLPFRSSLAALEPIRSSFPLKLAAAGILFVVVGFVLNSGVWAGILPIWGFALVLVGLGSYSFITLSQRGSQG